MGKCEAKIDLVACSFSLLLSPDEKSDGDENRSTSKRERRRSQTGI